MGCSTSENPPPDSSPSIMKRTPILPRNPIRPCPVPSTFAKVEIASCDCKTPPPYSRDVYKPANLVDQIRRGFDASARQKAPLISRITKPWPPHSSQHHRDERANPRPTFPTHSQPEFLGCRQLLHKFIQRHSKKVLDSARPNE